jgi:hypothetical protein
VEGDIGNTALATVALGQTLYFDDRCHNNLPPLIQAIIRVS